MNVNMIETFLLQGDMSLPTVYTVTVLHCSEVQSPLKYFMLTKNPRRSLFTDVRFVTTSITCKLKKFVFMTKCFSGLASPQAY